MTKMNNSISSIVLLAAVSLLLLSAVPYEDVVAQGPPPPSIVAVDTTLGFGSTGVYARRFLNINLNLGGDITYTQSAVNGDTFTINEDGVYNISYTNFSVVGDTFSISLNSPATADITFLAPANRLCSESNPAGHLTSCSATMLLVEGDIIRAHGSSGALADPGISSVPRFIIARSDF